MAVEIPGISAPDPNFPVKRSCVFTGVVYHIRRPATVMNPDQEACTHIYKSYASSA